MNATLNSSSPLSPGRATPFPSPSSTSLVRAARAARAAGRQLQPCLPLRAVARAIAVGVTLVWAGAAFGQDAEDRSQPPPPTLTVTGRGEAAAPPDTAVVQLGAVAEAKEAAAAQSQVNEILQRALKALRELKLPPNKIKTANLSLTPVYEQQERPRPNSRPRIVGYRASNSLQIETSDLTLVGKIIDAGVEAGANQIEGLSFELREDTSTRRQALQAAVEEARMKGDAIAAAMGIRIKGVRQVTEGGVHVLQPRVEVAQMRLAAVAGPATSVEPGEVRVEASVTVQYFIAERAGERR